MTREAKKGKENTNRLEKALAGLKLKQEKALAVYLMGGDPDPETSGEILKATLKGGADILEIGVPFSDPLADGSVIQEAGLRSLRNGTNILKIFNIVEEIRRDYHNPVALMLYYNTVFRFGTEKFLKAAAAKGVDALIIPDLPFEEKKAILSSASDNNIILIDFITPTTTEDRMADILKEARGFVYCVSLAGVTGARKKLASGFPELIGKVRNQTHLPLLAGFGISSPEQAEEAAAIADGVIVGSVLVEEIGRCLDDSARLPEVIKEKVSLFKKAI